MKENKKHQSSNGRFHTHSNCEKEKPTRNVTYTFDCFRPQKYAEYLAIAFNRPINYFSTILQFERNDLS